MPRGVDPRGIFFVIFAGGRGSRQLAALTSGYV